VKIALLQLTVTTKQTTERVPFAPTVSFIHGPVGTGKSTVARLVDYCLGGSLERTPAIQQEFVSAELTASLGQYTVQFERGLHDVSSVRVTWSDGDTHIGSASAPLDAGDVPLLGENVFNLSDLIFFLCGVEPIRVRKSKMDPQSPLVRLSFRDLMWYCYLQQDHLDSSFYRMEDPFRKLKSRDAMRFVTGLHSERMNELDVELVQAIDDQRTKRETVQQMRVFMARFGMGTEIDFLAQINEVEEELRSALARRDELERTRSVQTHAVEPLRHRLRSLSATLEDAQQAAADVGLKVQQYEALRSELITSKVKVGRTAQAGQLLQGVAFRQCPQCGAGLELRKPVEDACTLCGSPPRTEAETPSLELEALRRELNERIDDLTESLARHRRDSARQGRVLAALITEKRVLDQQLAEELSRYDSAYVSSVRAADRDVARLQERRISLDRLRALPQAINELEEQAGRLQGRIDTLRSSIEEERGHLKVAYVRIKRIGDRFLELMREVGFPGVYEGDHVELDPRSWLPAVHHSDVTWGFADAGSGGKKTLFNVLYALAVHLVAAEEDLPLPTFLIIDSPTKNISEDENPDLVKALYREIYALAAREGRSLQFVLIDSDLVLPEVELRQFTHRRMAGTPDAPCLISYYSGP
jgi:DNA repair exonuclease SbcCD ATPase subunit